MIGAGKIGKSEFWAQGDKTLFLECEPGLNHLSVNKATIRTWADVGNVYVELSEMIQAGKLPFDTIVIDTIDRFVGVGNDEVIERAKEHFHKIADQIHSIGDIPEGAGWNWATNLIHNGLNKFTDLPCATVLIGHVVAKEIKEPTRVVNKETINIGGQTGTKLLHWADHTLNVKSRIIGDSIQRVFRTKPTDTMDAGSRGNIVPDGFELTTDAKENYKRFRSLFD